MRPPLFWPITPLTERQSRKFDHAFNNAIDQAGSIGKLAPRLSAHSGEYISHQAMRNWLVDRKIPFQWALVMEDYTEGTSNFFDLIPWLLPRTVQWHDRLMTEQQRESA